MNYSEKIDYLFSQLPQYQVVGGKAYKASLDNITRFCNLLDNPQDKFKSIHVAGTNGKGSTSSLLASVLAESGYKVGLFTSPHLINFRERIVVNGIAISEDYISDFFDENIIRVQRISPSFFEWSTALAFNYFASEEVDIAIIETGLGGRLDSSNIIKPLASVITTIAIDHIQYLGNTLTKIAFEKGGIIKNNTPCIIGYGIDDEAKSELFRIANSKDSKLFIAEQLKINYQSGLLGEVQQYNISTVLETLRVVSSVFPKVNEDTIRIGLQNVTKNTLLRGRWEVLSSKPKIVADIAHNVQAVSVVVNQLAIERFKKLHIVWGMVEDKDIEKVVDLLPLNATYYLCQPAIKRAMDINVLSSFFKNKKAIKCFSCEDAYLKAKSTLSAEDFLLISGSNFVVSEVIESLGVN